MSKFHAHWATFWWSLFPWNWPTGRKGADQAKCFPLQINKLAFWLYISLLCVSMSQHPWVWSLGGPSEIKFLMLQSWGPDPGPKWIHQSKRVPLRPQEASQLASPGKGKWEGSHFPGKHTMEDFIGNTYAVLGTWTWEEGLGSYKNSHFSS